MIDKEKLKVEFLMTETELNDFLQVSKESLKTDLKTFEIALLNQNMNLIKKTAHKLKSGFNYLNLKSVADIFDQIKNANILLLDHSQINIMYQSLQKDIDILFQQLETIQ